MVSTQPRRTPRCPSRLAEATLDRDNRRRRISTYTELRAAYSMSARMPPSPFFRITQHAACTGNLTAFQADVRRRLSKFRRSMQGYRTV